MNSSIDLADELTKTILSVAHFFPWRESVIPFIYPKLVEKTPYGWESIRRTVAKYDYYGRLCVTVGNGAGKVLDLHIFKKSKDELLTQEDFVAQCDPHNMRPKSALSSALNSMKGRFNCSKSRGVSIVPTQELVQKLIWFKDPNAKQIFKNL
jgi:hypothetical protein